MFTLKTSIKHCTGASSQCNNAGVKTLRAYKLEKKESKIVFIDRQYDPICRKS